MKKQILLSSLAALALVSAAFLILPQNVPGSFVLENKNEEGETGLNKAQRIKEAMEARFNKLKDENGNFYSSYYSVALKQADLQKQSGSRAGGLNLQWEELGPDNVGGRTRAVLVDKRDPSNNTIYAGGVGGGMWKSTDGANTWRPLPNWTKWIAVSCIAQGPDNTIYIGTGEGLAQIAGTSFGSGSMGNGIFKLDANDNATLITPEGFPSDSSLNKEGIWAAVNRIAINPTDKNQIIAATHKGLYQLLPSGDWDPIVISGISNGQSAADVKWANDGIDIYAIVGGNNKVVRSRNGGFTWEKLAVALNPGLPTTQGRIEIALAPSDPNYVYLSIATTSGCLFAVYRTINATSDTVRWTNIGSRGPLFDLFGPNCQGWYDNTIAVSPTDPNKLYAGGIDFYTWSDLSGWKLADAGLGAGNSNPYYVHPDKHTIVFGNNDPNLMYIGCDGGVYKSTNASSAFPFPNYTIKNRGYNVTQNYSVGAGLKGDVLGGTQDNGTNYINYLGNTSMTSDAARGGDGTYAEISHIDPRIMFAGIYFGNNLRSGNGGSSFDGFYDIKVDPQGHTEPSRCGGQEGANAQFISPFWLGETKTAGNGFKKIPFVANRDYSAGEVISLESKTAKYPFQQAISSALTAGDTVLVDDPIRSRFFLHSFCGVWLTSDALDLGIIPRWYKLMNGMNGTAQSLCSSTDGDVVYVGTNSGRVYRCPNMNARCDTTTYPIGANAIGVIYTATSQYRVATVANARSIEGIAVNPSNVNHVVAVVSGFSAANLPHVYESKDGGVTWLPLIAGLPNMPVYDVVIHDDNTIIIGTELGVWSWDGSGWHEENDAFTQAGTVGMPRVPVYRLIEKNLYNDNCKVLYVGTHGRGMWRSTTLTAGGCNLNVTSVNDVKGSEFSNLNIFPNPVNSSSRISITLDKSADITFRVFDMTGKLYKEVIQRNATAGENQFNLDATGLSGGTYVLAATVGTTRTQSRLFTVTK
ncbi:MAG: T9SS type A sorting domain-containing protein [Bacteroidota bacterium]